MRKSACIVAVGLLLAPVARGADGPGKKVAVLDLRTGEGVDPFVGTSLTQVLAGRIARQPGMSVLARDDIAAMLSLEAQQQLLGCQDTGCLAELGGALGVDWLVSGGVARLGKALVVNMTLLEPAGARVLRRASDTWEGEASGLVGLVEVLAERLVVGDALEKGRIAFSATTPGARVTLDGEPAGTLPLAQLEVPAGRHVVELALEGHRPLRREVLVRPGRPVSVDARLEALPSRPLYARWWFWAAAGVLVAAATVGVLAATGGEDGNGGNGGNGGNAEPVDVSFSVRADPPTGGGQP